MSAVTATAMCELRQSMRDGRVWVAMLGALALFVVTFWVGVNQHARHVDAVRLATNTDRQVWEGQGARNPHSVAHFGQYAFKPAGALSAFDPGLTPWLGTALWMEAHYQNTAAFRPAEDQPPAIVATLSAAFVMQYVVSLALIFLGYGLVAAERERQTLKLAVAAGASPLSWVSGKLVALIVFAAVLWLPAWLPVIIVDTPDARLRAISLAAGYGIYLVILCLLVIAVSARAKTARSALLTLLCAWVLLGLVVPRLAVASAEYLSPSADAGKFWRDIRASLQQGLDGRGSADAQEAELMRKTLAKYGVNRVEDLPISFAGVALQAGEEHGNEVFDHFFDQMQMAQRAQDAVMHWSALATPWIAIRSLSAGMSGTDAVHHWHFVHAAENYRRELQRYLNGDMTRNARGQDFEYRADPTVWRQTPKFSYSSPPLVEVVGEYFPAAALLLLWLALSAFAMWSAARELEREGALP